MRKGTYIYRMLAGASVVSLAFFAPHVEADSSRNPAGVPGQVSELNEEKEARLPFPGLDPVFQPWYDAKSYLSQNLGLNFAIAYGALYQYSTETLTGKDQASGGFFETLGTWDLLDRGGDFEGTLGFRVEGRHRLWNSVAPQSLFAEIGAGVPTGLAFGEFDVALAELYWEQSFVKDRFDIRVGKILPFGYHDFLPFKNPKTAFTNASIALNPSIAWPQFGLGVATEIRPTKETYITAGLHDANGSPNRAGFDTFFDDQEFFKIAEIGWDPGFLGEDGKKNPLAPDYHATVWHTDARTASGRPEGWGTGFTATQPFGDVIAFGRYGYSDGGAALLKHLVMGGIAINNAFGYAQDTVGIAMSVGEPSAKNLDTQFTAEIYSKMQLTRRLSVSPIVQLIANPSANPDEDFLAVFGVRARVNF